MHKLSKIISLLFSAAFILMASTFAMAAPAEDFITPTGAQIQKEVSDINSAIKAKGGKWVAGETSMSVLSPAERRTRLGLAIPAPGETGPGQAADALSVPESGPALPSLSIALLPAVLDWRHYTVGASALSVNPGNYVTPVRNQASCGDCWVFGSVGALESRTLITQNTPGVKLDLSEEAVATCDTGDTPNGNGNACAGGLPVTSFFYSDGSNGTGRHGIPVESCDPYIEQNSGSYMRGSCSNNACSSYIDGFDSYGITGYTWTNNYWSSGHWSGGYYYPDGSVPTVDALKTALYRYGPVAVSFEVFDDFYSYKSGIYSYRWGNDVGGHLVLLVGYDDNNQCFIVKNSWGPGWGEGGFFRISYSQVGGGRPYYDGRWEYYGPFFGGYAVSYTGAVSPYLGSSIYYPSPSNILSKKIIGKAVCTITGLGQWDSQYYLKNVTVSTDGGNTWHPTRKTFTSSTWMTWSYNWPLPKDGTYTLMTMATDGYTNTQGGGITVAVDNTAPSSAITLPLKGDALNGASYPITGTAADNLSGVTGVEVSTDGGKTWNTANITSGAGTTSAAWSYGWTLSDGAYTIKSRAADIAQNVEKPLALAAVAVTVPSVVTLADIAPDGNSVTATASLANTAGTPVSGQAVSFYCAPEGSSRWALKSTVLTDGSGTCISHAFTLPAGSYQVKAVNKFAAGKFATSNIVPVVVGSIVSAR